VNTKKINLSAKIIIALLLVTAVFSVSWYISRPQSPALAAKTNVEQPVTIQDEAQSIPTDQFVSIFPLSQTVNGIAVELMSARLIDTGIEIGVCYPTPDGGEWYPVPGHLFYDTYEVLPDEAELLSEQLADGVKMGRHCELIRYRIDDLTTVTLPIRISFLGYWAVPREIPPCENFRQRLETSPKAKAYGLKAKCTEDGQGGISVVLLSKASSVAKGEAQKALDEIVKGEITGPWEFVIYELEK